MAMMNGIDLVSAASPGGRKASIRPGATGAATADKTHVLKPLEELTDADIKQLTREDCRRYLKERGMRRPSWNKAQAIQQVLSLKSLMCSSKPKTISAGNDIFTVVNHSLIAAPVPHTKQLLDKVSEQSRPQFGPSNHNSSDPPACFPSAPLVNSRAQQSFSNAPPPSDPTACHFPVRPKVPHKAQLTIFYSGVVNVYEDVPLEKAQAIMLLAASKAFHVPNPTPSTTALLNQQQQQQQQQQQTPAAVVNHVYVPPPFFSGPPEPVTGATSAPLNAQQHEESTDSGLPQARTVSLQRFLAKRRERISANPSFYRRSDKQANKRSKPSSSSSSPPGGTLPLLPPPRTRSPLRSTNSHTPPHKLHSGEFSAAASKSTASVSSDASGGSSRTTATMKGFFERNNILVAGNLAGDETT